jgi:hypothetical protein
MNNPFFTIKLQLTEHEVHMEKRLYLLKIRLHEIEPEIWRRFVVPAEITLDRLHDVIQIVMGWKDYHFHEFVIGKNRYTENPRSKEDGKAGGMFRLVDLIKQKGRAFSYVYDFGDQWEHEIILEDNRYFNPEIDGPLVCIEGERACPPEDVGGMPGYFEFVSALKNPAHGEHKNYKSWYAGFPWYDKDFDSERYDIEKINYELMKYLRWSRNRMQLWQYQL